MILDELEAKANIFKDVSGDILKKLDDKINNK